MPDFKYHSTGAGFCQVNYKAKNEKGQILFYCLMNNKMQGVDNVQPHRCTSDWEPSYPISDKGLTYEPPPKNQDSRTDNVIRDYLNNRSQ